MAKLFLSYSRKDEARAQRFTKWLEREGHDVWRDEDDIGGGASFSSEIEKALNACEAVLVLWSADSVQSAWVRDEASVGRDGGKLIPFSLDASEPPLGFRQFQSIDLSKWRGRGEPPAADRIRSAIRRVAAAGSIPPSVSAVSRREKPLGFSRRAVLGGSAVMLAVAAGSGVLLWRHSEAGQGVTIAVMASPTSPDRAMAADYANLTAADMAAFLPTRFDGATVIAPADATRRTYGYRMIVSANRHGSGADASLTLSDSDGQAVIWSKSWSIPDASPVDLPQQVSRAASQAALCLTDARGGTKRIDQPALGLYLGECVGVADPNWSNTQLLAASERLVKLAPDFPRAWAGLALGRAILASELQDRSGTADADAVKSARDAIARARKLDPRSALAYVAEWHLVNSDPLQGLAVLDKAVKLAPDEPLLHAHRSDSLAAVGRMAESVDEARRAVELDPLSSFTRSQYILALAYAGDLSRAKADIADARKKWPNDPNIDWAEQAFNYRYGDPRVAQQLMPRTVDMSDAELAPNLKFIASRLDPSPGKIDDSIATFRARARIEPRIGINRLVLALGTFGRTDSIYQLLADPKDLTLIDPEILFRPEFADVRADPRFMAVAARFGLVRYWRQSGNWPDFCASEQLKYDCKAEAAKYPS